MRFGVCTDVDNIEVAQRLGFAYIECYAAGLAAMTEEEFERAKAAVEQSSIQVECFNGLFPGDFSLLGARMMTGFAATWTLCSREWRPFERHWWSLEAAKRGPARREWILPRDVDSWRR